MLYLSLYIFYKSSKHLQLHNNKNRNSEESSSAFSSPVPYKRPRVVAANNVPLASNEPNAVSDRPIQGTATVNLEEIYRNGRRCVILDRGLKEHKWRMASFRATLVVAETIFSNWESDSKPTTGDSDLRSRKQQFSNYVVGFVMRTGPSVVTILHALQYTLRLRSIYPRARGEKGCAHRLFVVALLVSARYLQDHQVLIKPNHTTWATLSGVFTAPELLRMEVEFVTFLRGKLYIGAAELDRCIEENFFFDDSEMGNLVPGGTDWLELISVKEASKSDSSHHVPDTYAQ